MRPIIVLSVHVLSEISGMKQLCLFILFYFLFFLYFVHLDWLKQTLASGFSFS